MIPKLFTLTSSGTTTVRDQSTIYWFFLLLNTHGTCSAKFGSDLNHLTNKLTQGNIYQHLVEFYLNRILIVVVAILIQVYLL
jgi:hypothetical protein